MSIDRADCGQGSAQQQLATATGQIDALLTLNLELKEEVALLKEALAKIKRFAFHDELTGLPNRRLLQDHFDQAVAIPYIIDRKPIRMKAAIGMAVYPVDGKRYDDLLQAADFTMYDNKPCTATAQHVPKPRLAGNGKAG